MSIQERAKEFVTHDLNGLVHPDGRLHVADKIADHATLEREAAKEEAVREFIEKVKQRADELFMQKPGATHEPASADVFRKMFGKNL